MLPTCDTCVFAEQAAARFTKEVWPEGLATCHRYPPAPIQPVVSRNDWCGEHVSLFPELTDKKV